MRQVSLGLIVFLCFCFPIPVNAQAPTDNYIKQLIELGYDEVEVSKTFLGRYRILATRDGQTRELIVARNGQILFDYLDVESRTPSFAPLSNQDDGTPAPVASDNSVDTQEPDRDDGKKPDILIPADKD